MFQRHRYLSYQGYALPWFVAVMWIVFLTAGVWYMVKNILIDG